MNITYMGKTLSFSEHTRVSDCIRAFQEDIHGVLAVMIGAQVAELNDELFADCELIPLTLRDEEGRRIYERSLRFVMLLAIHHLYPGQRVRVEYSVGNGIFVRLPGMRLDSGIVHAIRDEMKRIIEKNLPFEKKTWNLHDAIRYFEVEGQEDKVQLLRTRPFRTFTMYRCDGMWEYFYGAMASSTGSVPVFDLLMLPGPDGFAIQLPTSQNPAVPAPYLHRAKYMQVFSQSAQWCDILGVQNVADLTERVRDGGFRTFIRVNEALHEQALGRIAREIVQAQKRIVLVAGPSSSGKTTSSGRLAVQLQALGYQAYRISLDDYYLDRDTLPQGPDGSVDLETIDAIDTPLIKNHMERLLAGEEVEIPKFSFQTGKREALGTKVQLQPEQIVIFEGIHALNPMLCEGLPEREIHRVFVSALTCLNIDDHNRIRTTDVRLLRRVVRDYLYRGTLPEDTLNMWDSVRNGEEKWIFPYQEYADSVFNTALHYELPVLRHFAYQMLDAIDKTQPCYVMSRRLMKMLHYVPDCGEAALNEIPPLSLLREFIGGCTLEQP